MGAFLCKPSTKPDEPAASNTRRVRSRSSTKSDQSVAQVLGSYDLLQQVLQKLAPGNGCDARTRSQVAQVCRLWRQVARTLPLSIQLESPLSDKQVEQLRGGRIPCVRHMSFSIGERRGHEVLASQEFQRSSGASLVSVLGLPFQDGMSHLAKYPELQTLSLCRRNWVTLLELVRGTRHSTQSLGGLAKLKSLTLKDLAGPQAALDLSFLPTSLEHLHLVNTSFVHHPEMALPEGLHLHSLTSSSLGRRSTIIPVELLRRAKQAILRGKEVYLTGSPTDAPEMEEDSMEIVINGGMLLLFTFGEPRVQHETRTAAILRQLENSDLQVLRLCTEPGGTTHLVDRSDCRKGLRWKSVEVATPSSFVAELQAGRGGSPSGFGCRVEERHPDGSIQSLSLSRAGQPRDQAEAAIAHLTLLQKFLVDQLEQLEEHVRHLGQMLDSQDE